ncbi:MAG: PilZ domain-containing protein [Desulfoprunum sp.]|nr:PilZ domain-containing protein [Desulfoprunum sp.]
MARRLHFFHFFRKSPRYSVNLEVECYERERGLRFPGTALNISTDGLMANIATLDRLYENMIIKIIFPQESGAHLMELPVEHLWMHEYEGQFCHGFRFHTFDGNQQQLIFKFLVEYKKGY